MPGDFAYNILRSGHVARDDGWAFPPGSLMIGGNVMPAEPASPATKDFLSSSTTGAVDLHTGDGGSGAQRWGFYPLGGSIFNIKVQGGTNSGEEYLSYSSDGSVVDLYDRDDGSGRQRWFVSEMGDTCRIIGVGLVVGQQLELSIAGDGVHLGREVYWWQLKQVWDFPPPPKGFFAQLFGWDAAGLPSKQLVYKR